MKRNGQPKKPLEDPITGLMHDGPRQKPKTADEFIQGLIALGRRTIEAMAALDAAEQALFLQQMFERSHVVWAVWQDTNRQTGYSVAMVKGSSDEMETAFAAGEKFCVSSVVLVADQAEALSYYLVWQEWLACRNDPSKREAAMALWDGLTPKSQQRMGFYTLTGLALLHRR